MGRMARRTQEMSHTSLLNVGLWTISVNPCCQCVLAPAEKRRMVEYGSRTL